MRALRHLLTLLLLLLVASTASAQDAASAEQLFNEGMKLLEAGSYDDACKKLKASLEADASGGAALNLGRCNESRGKPATAWANYEQAVVLFRASGETEREKFAQERAAVLKPTLSWITIEAVETPGLVVTRDGAKVAGGALGSAVPLDPGEYTIEASAPGYQSWSKAITVFKGGDDVKVTIPALEKLPTGDDAPPVGEPEPAEEGGSSGLVITGAVLLGVGSVAAIIGAVVGGTVLSGSSDAENDPALCDDKTCTPAGREEIDSLEATANVSNVLLGVGGAVAVGGLILLIVGVTSDGAAEGDVALLPSASPEGGALLLRGRF